MIWLVLAINLGLAVAFVAKSRAISRARGDSIPFMVADVNVWVLLVAVVAVAGWITANSLTLVATGDFGRNIQAVHFVLFLACGSAATITFIIMLHGWHVSRHADLWVRLVAPSQLTFRVGETETTVALTPNMIEVARAQGPGGVLYLQYGIPRDGRMLNLAAPASIAQTQKFAHVP